MGSLKKDSALASRLFFIPPLMAVSQKVLIHYKQRETIPSHCVFPLRVEGWAPCVGFGREIDTFAMAVGACWGQGPFLLHAFKLQCSPVICSCGCCVVVALGYCQALQPSALSFVALCFFQLFFFFFPFLFSSLFLRKWQRTHDSLVPVSPQ